MKFEFRLERLLALAHQEEHAKEQRLAEAASQASQKLAELQARRQTLAELQRSRAGDRPLAPQEWSALALAVERARREVHAAEAALEEAICCEAACRDELIAARRRREMLERLRENAFARFLSEARRAERKELDEAGGQRYLRRRGRRGA